MFKANVDVQTKRGSGKLINSSVYVVLSQNILSVAQLKQKGY